VDPIRIAVIGCGEIAQVMHLPYLAELPAFELAAICDLSPTLLERVGDRYSVPLRSRDHADVLDGVDAVAILTHDHADIAEKAAQRGKHLFVEKPLGYSIEECDRVIAAARASGVKLMVGYMRRFDPGYVYALERIAALGSIRFVRAHDFGGSFAIHPAVYALARGDDVPTGVIETGQRQITETMCTALGSDHEHLVEVYYGTIMSGIHDLAMLRGMLGSPTRIVHSELVGKGGLVSLLDYGAGCVCSFEQALMTDYSWWDQYISVYADTGVVSIDVPNPYIRNAPTTVRVQTSEGDSPTTTAVTVSYDSPFKREWIHFADCIRNDREPLTNGEDARADVEVALAMVQAVRP
jgi:predicted dehydrogenase